MEVRTMIIDGRPTIAVPDDDPHLWLEEIEGERALAFVEQQNKATLEKFGSARFAADRDALAAIFDRPDNIPFVTRRGEYLYNLWKDASNPRGLWRRTTLDEFRSPDPTWETILDVDKLAADESEDWILSWIQTLPGNQPRAILSLSRGGGDAAVLREFDIDTKSFVKDGFFLPEAKGGAGWLDADTLLLSSAFGEGMATTSGYARTITGHGAAARMSVRRPCCSRPLPTAWRSSWTLIGQLRLPEFGLSKGWVSSMQICGWAMRPDQGQSSICRPTSGRKLIATGLP
jgi:prolyl oligopeptidase